MARRFHSEPIVVDIAVASAVVLAATLGLAATEPGVVGLSPLRWVLGVAVGVALLARRRAPEVVLLAIALVAAFQGIVLRELPGFASFLALLVAAFSVGAHGGIVTGVAALGISLLGVLVAGAVTAPLSAEGVVIPFVYLGASWGIGRLVGARTAHAQAAVAEADRLARRQADVERLAIADERARISRELHDVVAHAVTTVVLQAGAAQAELGEGGADTRIGTRLGAIEAAGREALEELRRLLAVTRPSDGDDPTPEPAPGIADLRRLVERAAASGPRIELSVEVDSELPPALSLSAYRIVQEALTNLLKHATATRAWVRVAREADTIVVEVRDDGKPGGPSAVAGTGRGLIGMRERAAVFGGRLEAGRDPVRGGYVVRARLPLSEAAT